MYHPHKFCELPFNGASGDRACSPEEPRVNEGDVQ